MPASSHRSYEWRCVYDADTTKLATSCPPLPERVERIVYGPNAPSWAPTWEHAGTHTIECKTQLHAVLAGLDGVPAIGAIRAAAEKLPFGQDVVAPAAGSVQLVRFVQRVGLADRVLDDSFQHAKALTANELRTELMKKDLGTSEMGLSDQRLGRATDYITSDGPNPADNSWSGALRHTQFTVHPNPAARRFRWYAQPRDWDNMPAESLDGNVRAQLDGQPVFEMPGRGPTAAWPNMLRNVYTIICNEYDEHDRLTGRALYIQVVQGEEQHLQTMALRKHIALVDNALASIKDGAAVPIKGVHVSIENGISTPLNLYIGPDAHKPGQLRIVDLLPGADTVDYGGDVTGHALDDFQKRNTYPKGEFKLVIPENKVGIEHSSRSFSTTGKSAWSDWAGRTGWASMGLTVGGVVSAAVGLEPLAAVCFIGAAATGAASSGLGIYDELNQPKVSWLAVGLDVLTLASSLIGGGGAARALLTARGVAIEGTHASARFVHWANYTIGGFSGVMISISTTSSISQVLQSDLPEHQKLDLVVRILASAALQGALMLLGHDKNVKGARPRSSIALASDGKALPIENVALDTSERPRSPHEGTESEQETPVRGRSKLDDYVDSMQKKRGVDVEPNPEGLGPNVAGAYQRSTRTIFLSEHARQEGETSTKAHEAQHAYRHAGLAEGRSSAFLGTAKSRRDTPLARALPDAYKFYMQFDELPNAARDLAQAAAETRQWVRRAVRDLERQHAKKRMSDSMLESELKQGMRTEFARMTHSDVFDEKLEKVRRFANGISDLTRRAIEEIEAAPLRVRFSPLKETFRINGEEKTAHALTAKFVVGHREFDIPLAIDPEAPRPASVAALISYLHQLRTISDDAGVLVDEIYPQMSSLTSSAPGGMRFDLQLDQVSEPIRRLQALMRRMDHLEPTSSEPALGGSVRATEEVAELGTQESSAVSPVAAAEPYANPGSSSGNASREASSLAIVPVVPKGGRGVRLPVVTLDEMKKRFGPEIQPSSEFEIGRMSDEPDEFFGMNGKQASRRWLPYQEFEVAHHEDPLGYGRLVFRSLDSRHYFSLPAELPRAKQIIRETILPQAPVGFQLSPDGRFFEGAHGQSLPTPETINHEMQLNEESPAHFVRASNAWLGPQYHHRELIQNLADGEIPVVLGKGYHGDGYQHHLAVARNLMTLTKSSDWMRFRKFLNAALAITRRPDVLSSDRYKTDRLIGDAQRLLYRHVNSLTRDGSSEAVYAREAAAFNKEIEEFERKLADIRVVPQESRGPLALGGGAPTKAAPLEPKHDLTSRAPALFTRGKAQAAEPEHLEEHERPPEVSPYVQLSPDDLVAFLNDWKFASFQARWETPHSTASEYDYFRWLNDDITGDKGGSPNSFRSQRVDLKLLILRQYPSLGDLHAPAGLSQEEGAQWLRDQIAHLLGERIAIRRVAHGDERTAYEAAAHARYSRQLREDAFDFGFTAGARGATQRHNDLDLSWAYERLEVPIGVDESAIKAAYRKLAKKNHPDVNHSNPDFEEKMKKINNAFDALMGRKFNPE